jgi:NAD(P)-dependent dehydrogenase (short-subunit alcohol dehydrogenase family)
VRSEISIHSSDGRQLGNVRPEFVGKTGLIIGGSCGIGKAVGRLLLEKRAEAVVIVGKNKKKLLSAEVELGSFGQVITNKDVRYSTVRSSSRRNRERTSPLSICGLTAPELSFPNPFLENQSPQIRMQEAPASLQSEALRPSGIL